jgi:hypothetical protein
MMVSNSLELVWVVFWFVRSDDSEGNHVAMDGKSWSLDQGIPSTDGLWNGVLILALAFGLLRNFGSS